jgi:hypothetical protein
MQSRKFKLECKKTSAKVKVLPPVKWWGILGTLAGRTNIDCACKIFAGTYGSGVPCLMGYDFAEGQPVRIIKRVDEYAQLGWSGDVKPHLVEIKGDVYDQSIE